MSILIPDDQELYDFQIPGAQFLVDNECALLADQMGLGKTPQAIAAINTVQPKTVLIIVPANLKKKWYRELRKWLVDPRLTVGVMYGTGELPNTNILIINYDLLIKPKVLNQIHDWAELLGLDMIIADESHYIKNLKSNRTVATLGLKDHAPRRILLTGTPITKRPWDLWPQLMFLGVVNPAKQMKYKKRYCDRKLTAIYSKRGRFIKNVWNDNGASNLGELNKFLQKFMLRRLKADVLKDLPPKTREVIEIDLNGAGHSFKRLVNKEKNAWRQVLRKANEFTEASYEVRIRQLYKEYMKDERSEIATARREQAEASIPMVVNYLRDCLECEDKVVVFAHHRSVVDGIYEHFKGIGVKLYGGMTDAKKDKAWTSFQEDPEVRLFIGNIQAAGVGIDLFAASLVVFAELDWLPSNVSQAEDRLHRIGQVNAVNVQHLVVEGSMNVKIAHRLIQRQNMIDKAVDGGELLSVFEDEPDVVEELLSELHQNDI